MNYIDMYNDALQHGEIIACKRVKVIFTRPAAEIEKPGTWAFDEGWATRPIACACGTV